MAHLVESCGNLNETDCETIDICLFQNGECKVREEWAEFIHDKYINKYLTDILNDITEKDDESSLPNLVKAILNLDIKNIVTSIILKKKVLQFLNTLKQKNPKQKLLNLYQRLTSKYFLTELMPTFDIENKLKTKNVQKNLFENIVKYYKENDPDRMVIYIYNFIHTAVSKILNETPENTSIVYNRAQNVDNTESIEELGMSSFESIVKNFKTFEIFDKQSASNTIIFTAFLNNNASNSVNVVRSGYTLNSLKIYFKLYPTLIEADGIEEIIENYGLQFEKKCYEELFKLVKYNITPNILCTISITPKLRDFTIKFLENRKLNTVFREEMKKEVKKCNNNAYNPEPSKWLETSVIMTQPGGTQFAVSFPSLSIENGKKILFQLFYTLYVFEKIEFNHGDLHFGNMFIITLPQERELIYIVEGKQFRFTTTYLLKIYDFDRSLICKETNIKVNTTKSEKIEYVSNIQREDITFWLSRTEGLYTIFNNQYDIARVLIFLAILFHDSTSEQKKIVYNPFMRRVFPGPFTITDTIKDTYSKLLTYGVDTTVEQGKEIDINRQKANKIFNINLDFSSRENINYSNYGIHTTILDLTWKQYFFDKNILVGGKKLNNDIREWGVIKKSLDATEEPNHMWIPDTIIIPKKDILNDELFAEFISEEPIDVTKDIVYTIDNRVL